MDDLPTWASILISILLPSIALAEYFKDEERRQINFAWDSLNFLFMEYGEDDGEKDGHRFGMAYSGNVIQHFNN